MEYSLGLTMLLNEAKCVCLNPYSNGILTWLMKLLMTIVLLCQS